MLKYFIYYKYIICNKEYSISYDSDSDSYIHMSTPLYAFQYQLYQELSSSKIKIYAYF